MPKHSWRDPHVIRSTKSFFKSLYVALCVFVVLFVAFHIVGAIYISSLGDKASTDLEKGILSEELMLEAKGDVIAQNKTLIQDLVSRDIKGLFDVVQKEKADRGIDVIAVTDSAGVILARNKTTSRVGDNVFLTTPQGRAVALGREVQTVEASNIDPTIMMIVTGRPIKEAGEMIGALFTSAPLNDNFAAKFKSRYLPKGAEVVFYNNDFGPYGDSFSDPEKRKLIDSYFNSGSEWVKGALSDRTVSFDYNTYFLVKNIALPGLEQSSGGALIFVPRHDISQVANITIAFLTLFTFVFCLLLYHFKCKAEERGWRYWLMFVSTLIPVLMIAFFTLYFQNGSFLRLERVSYLLYNSTLRLQPESGIYRLGSEQKLTVMVDTGDESINAVQVSLSFDPKAVEVKALNVATSTCSYVITSKIDNVLGKVNLSCVILDREEGVKSLPIVDIVAKPKAKGTFDFTFNKPDTKVLANDGLGTNVLRMSQDGSYRADNFHLAFEGDKNTSTSTARSFVVFSPTHPNQSKWYAASKAHFVWQGDQGAVYKYEFDNLPDTIPSDDETVQGSGIDVPIPGDGIFYFHLQLASGGPVAHYRLQSDMTPPSIIAIHSSKERIMAGDVVRFSFEASDAGSGVQRNYYIDLGNHLFLPAGEELFVPFINAGEQKLTLRVYDAAGNYSEKSQIIDVIPK